MPREQVNRGLEIRTPAGENPDGSPAFIHRPYMPNMQGAPGDEIHHLPTVHLAWYPGLLGTAPNVEVIIEVDMDWMAEYVDAWRKNGDGNVPRERRAQPDSRGVVHAQLFERREVNTLISIARRARDKVFGADE